jgi:hypothetical protein
MVQELQSDTHYVWVQGLSGGERVIVHENKLILSGMKVSANIAKLASGAF